MSAPRWGAESNLRLHRLLALAVASRIVSMSAPWFESPDAYESMATRGSTPNCFAVCADATAICASSSAEGATLIAQSPNTLTPSFSSMKNTDDTISKPGAVFSNCNAGLPSPPYYDKHGNHAVGDPQFHHHRAEGVRVVSH